MERRLNSSSNNALIVLNDHYSSKKLNIFLEMIVKNVCFLLLL